jgi:hypothetical protein
MKRVVVHIKTNLLLKILYFQIFDNKLVQSLIVKGVDKEYWKCHAYFYLNLAGVSKLNFLKA